MKRIVTVLVYNKNGVLLRLTALFTKRQLNIKNISVGQTETEGVSKITFLVNLQDLRQLEQIIQQLKKQIDVLQVKAIPNQGAVVKELALIKVVSNGQTRGEINGIIEPFRASVIDICRDSITVQVTGNISKIEALIDLLKPYGIKEIARTGIAAFTRGNVKEVEYVSTINS